MTAAKYLGNEQGHSGVTDRDELRVLTSLRDWFVWVVFGEESIQPAARQLICQKINPSGKASSLGNGIEANTHRQRLHEVRVLSHGQNAE